MRFYYAPALVLFDLISYYVSLYLAVSTREIVDDIFPSIMEFGFSYQYFVTLWWMPLILIAVIAYKGLYTKAFTTFDETKGVISAVSFALIIVFAIISAGKMNNSVSRLVIVFLWFFSIIIYPIMRRFSKRLLFSLGIGTERVIIIGTGENAVSAATAILRESNCGYVLRGFYSIDNNDIRYINVLGKEYPVLNGDLEETLDRFTSVVFVDEKGTNYDSISATARRKSRNIITVPDSNSSIMMNSEFQYIFNSRLFLLKSKNNLSSMPNIVLKRVFDILFTLAVLPFVSIVILIFAVAICFESWGFPFYTHKRIGKNGKTIGVFKMRSMYKDADRRLKEIIESNPERKAEWETTFKLKNDPRVTKIGRFIRKTSIDELPQFFNVLIGNMSIVGPRPIVRAEVEDYYGKDAEYYCMVHPGITGLWQVSGRSNTDYSYRIALDSWYVMNWSMGLDIMIILKTVKAVLKKEGAY